jgi:outer membrane immunogenic protein
MCRLSVVLIVAVFAIAFAQPARAADLPVKAPAKPPVIATTYNWTGFYVGAHAGYGWSDGDLALTSVGIPDPGAPVFAASSASATPPTLGTHLNGFIGGGQFGFNYQTASQWVWGLEADLSFAGIKGSDTQTGTTGPIPTFPGVIPVNVTAIGDQKLNFFGTVRGRVGFTPVDSLLVYATGGLAFGRIESGTSTSDAFSVFGISPASGSASTMRTGWTAGGGIESALTFAPRWSAKVEYLYYDLGTLTYALSTAAVSTGVPPTGLALGFVNTAATADFRGSLVRVGLNYRLN